MYPYKSQDRNQYQVESHTDYDKENYTLLIHEGCLSFAVTNNIVHSGMEEMVNSGNWACFAEKRPAFALSGSSARKMEKNLPHG